MCRTAVGERRITVFEAIMDGSKKMQPHILLECNYISVHIVQITTPILDGVTQERVAVPFFSP